MTHRYREQAHSYKGFALFGQLAWVLRMLATCCGWQFRYGEDLNQR
jgi:hypothetical protein